jgi:hypothetical protein
VTPVHGEGGDAAIPTRADPALVKALARAFRYQRLLDEAQYASISEMAAAERIERGYLGTLLRLTLLAPDIVEAGRSHASDADRAVPWQLDRAAEPVEARVRTLDTEDTDKAAWRSGPGGNQPGRNRTSQPSQAPGKVYWSAQGPRHLVSMRRAE